jgi:3-methyladenine DNA glycosylase/8-oxoguanine DNA glycosylase
MGRTRPRTPLVPTLQEPDRLRSVPTRTIALDAPFDLVGTLRPLARGAGDPTLRLADRRAWRTTRTPDGAATVAIVQRSETIEAEAWGPGADRALADLPTLLGLGDGPFAVADHHRVVTELARRARGLRLPRSEAVLEALVPAILEQKVTGDEARRAWRSVIRAHGSPAPGPATFRLRLPPEPAVLARLPYYAWHPFGVEQRRADLIRRVASRAAWFEATVSMALPDAYARLTALSGIGPWTAAEVAVRAFGDPDAVSVGDFHLPNLVAYALAGEPRADDARMLELLEPWRGERARVIRLLETSGIRTPRYGPRLTPRHIEGT